MGHELETLAFTEYAYATTNVQKLFRGRGTSYNYKHFYGGDGTVGGGYIEGSFGQGDYEPDGAQGVQARAAHICSFREKSD